MPQRARPPALIFCTALALAGCGRPAPEQVASDGGSPAGSGVHPVLASSLLAPPALVAPEAKARPVSLAGGVTEQARTDFYDVTGFTAAQVRASLDQNVRVREGRRFESFTEW